MMDRNPDEWETLVYWLVRKGYRQQAINLMPTDSPLIACGPVSLSLSIVYIHPNRSNLSLCVHTIDGEHIDALSSST